MQDIIIVGLEGTLTNHEHRGTPTHPEDFQGWEEKLIDDPANQVIVDIIAYLPHSYFILSYKPIQYKYLCEEWIDKRMNFFPDFIFLRSCNDHGTRQATKHKWLVEIKKTYNPILAIDSRESVCAMYRANGVETLHYKNTL